MAEIYRKTFKLNTWEWWAYYGGTRPSFCKSGVRTYFDIPLHVREADLVFSDTELEDSLCVRTAVVMRSFMNHSSVRLSNYCSSGGTGIGLPWETVAFLLRILTRFNKKRLWLHVEY